VTSPTTIKRVWKQYLDRSYKKFDEDIDPGPKFKGKCGLTGRVDAEEVEFAIKNDAGGYITYGMIEKRLKDIGFIICPSTIRNYCLRLNMQEVPNFIRRMKRL